MPLRLPPRMRSCRYLGDQTATICDVARTREHVERQFVSALESVDERFHGLVEAIEDHPTVFGVGLRGLHPALGLS